MLTQERARTSARGTRGTSTYPEPGQRAYARSCVPILPVLRAVDTSARAFPCDGTKENRIPAITVDIGTAFLADIPLVVGTLGTLGNITKTFRTRYSTQHTKYEYLTGIDSLRALYAVCVRLSVYPEKASSMLCQGQGCQGCQECQAFTRGTLKYNRGSRQKSEYAKIARLTKAGTIHAPRNLVSRKLPARYLCCTSRRSLRAATALPTKGASLFLRSLGSLLLRLASTTASYFPSARFYIAAFFEAFLKRMVLSSVPLWCAAPKTAFGRNLLSYMAILLLAQNKNYVNQMPQLQ